MLAIALLGLIIALSGVAQALSNKQSARKGADWLERRQISGFTEYGSRADAVMALVAARKHKLGVKDSSVERFSASLKSKAASYASSAGAAGKLALAAVAAGESPRCFGVTGDQVDLIGVINDAYSKGRYGSTSFDQALAMLALAAAREPIPTRAIKFVRDRRGQRGWGFAMRKGPGDDIDSTAIMIEAMRAAGVARNDSGLKAALRWIRLQRNSDGGFNPNGNGAESQANTTALAIRAAKALGTGDNAGRRALRKLQKKPGYFQSTAAAKGSPELATPDAVVALSGERLPVRKRKSRDSCRI